jgi:hypothetical protein
VNDNTLVIKFDEDDTAGGPPTAGAAPAPIPTPPAGPRVDAARLAEAIGHIAAQPGAAKAGMTPASLAKWGPEAVL